MFRPMLEGEGNPFEQPTMEIPDSLYEEYARAVEQWVRVSDKMEQLYRLQEKLAPRETPAVPEHRMIEE